MKWYRIHIIWSIRAEFILLVIFGALIVGLSLGLMGSGGAILTMPVLLFGLDQPEKLAIINSLAIVFLISGFQSFQLIINKVIDLPLVLYFGVPSLIGAYFGAILGNLASGEIQLLVFSISAFAAAIKILINSNSDSKQSDSGKTGSRMSLMGIGVLVGVLTGFVGVGGGFLIVPALIIIARLDLKQAVATSLVIITFNSLVGFLTYYIDGNYSVATFDWLPILIIASIGLVGSMFGQKLKHSLPQDLLQKSFAVTLVFVGAAISYQYLVA